MKIRMGFVSNSSSSSFICDVCFSSYEGWDGEYDFEYYICENNHYVCDYCIKLVERTINDFILDPKEAAKKIDFYGLDRKDFLEAENKKVWLKDNLTNGKEIKKCLCPVCNLSKISPTVEITYLRKKFNVKMEEVHNEIRFKYKDLDELWKDGGK